MITFKIKESSPQAKKLVEYIKTLDYVEIVQGLGKPNLEITNKQKALINKLKKIKKEVDLGNYKGKSAQSFLNEI